MTTDAGDRRGGLLRFPGHVAASPRVIAPPGAATLGLRLLLVSLAVLFAAGVVAYVVVWLEAPLPAEALPPLPASLWLGTGLLAASGATIHAALVAARRGRGRRLACLLLATTALGAAFLACQAASWLALWSAASAAAPALGRYAGVYLVQFGFMTGLHAAHVLGGLAVLSYVTIAAWRGRYSAAWHGGVRHAATYWHFLGAVWLVLLATLVIAR